MNRASGKSALPWLCRGLQQTSEHLTLLDVVHKQRRERADAGEQSFQETRRQNQQTPFLNSRRLKKEKSSKDLLTTINYFSRIKWLTQIREGFFGWFGFGFFFRILRETVQLLVGGRRHEETLSFFLLAAIKAIQRNPAISCKFLTNSHASARTKTPRLWWWQGSKTAAMSHLSPTIRDKKQAVYFTWAFPSFQVDP